MTGQERPIYIVLGTRAQFIKMAPLMRAMLDNGLEYRLIYTAQHRESVDEILDLYDLPRPDVLMYPHAESNTMKRGLRWALEILFKAIFTPKRYLPRKGMVLTHGDTFTAWLAALMGKRARCRVGHVESGLRSFNLFKPFPEEISRLVTFALSDVYFCPNEWAMRNLARYKGDKINLEKNPVYDAVKYALEHEDKANDFDFGTDTYAVVAIHRYENIFKPVFTETIIPYLQEISKRIKLVVSLHPSTRERLKGLGLYDELDRNERIVLHARFGFFDWIKVCRSAQYVITDGGSNQEELSYLGLPTLLFRTETERQEGLGVNAVLSRLRWETIERFVNNPARYRTQPEAFERSPSQKIVDYLKEHPVF